MSKIFEKLLLDRLLPIITERGLIPNHQFGFRQHHSTIEQIHRVTQVINQTTEEKKYCPPAFPDITQAFDKIWHDGLLFKLRTNLPLNYFLILQSYLQNRHFLVRYQDEQTTLHPIRAGVPQGSALGLTLYLIYTADLPTTPSVTTGTYADDTAILSPHQDPTVASQRLQTALNKIQSWMKTWRTRVNEGNSVQATFTTRRNTCPPVSLNNRQLKQCEDVEYLGMHLDRRMTWKKHICTKHKQPGIKFSKLYWLIGRRSQLSLYNKFSVYKAILKPISSYGLQLWGSASKSNTEILE
jgi:hypothetical protein